MRTPKHSGAEYSLKVAARLSQTQSRPLDSFQRWLQSAYFVEQLVPIAVLLFKF